MLKLNPFLLLFLYHSVEFASAASSDTLTLSGSLSGNETLVSAGAQFELGFFTTDSNNSNKSYYVGIWYFNIGRTVVWVTNRNSPAWTSSALLRINGSGSIFVSDVRRSEFIFISNQSKATTIPVLQLLDNGNLVVRGQDDVSADDYLWQSFDHPTDTLLPGQKYGWDNKTGLNIKFFYKLDTNRVKIKTLPL